MPATGSIGVPAGRGASSVSIAGLTDPLVVFVARRLQVLAEANRIRILRVLAQREATVQELTDELDSTHSNVSKHLAVLYEAGIVSRRKDGASVWYALADFTASRLIELAAASATGFIEDLAALTEHSA